MIDKLEISTITDKLEISTLEDTLSYKNNAIINKFLESYKVSFEEAEELFIETKKWLWLGAYTKKSNKILNSNYPTLFIDSSMLMLDEMWHTFILFTKEYHAFCDKNFGFYMHHAPTTKKEKDELKKRIQEDKKSVYQESIDKNKEQYGIIYDLLGGETLQKWYETFADKYSSEKIRELKII